MKILLVEDDQPVGVMLSETLTTHHYTVDVVTDGKTGLDMVTAWEYDMILLDLLIPKLDGISLCRQLRSQGYQKPILLLTAKDSNADIVRGLDAGADDCVTKPYEMSELMARIRALLRRGGVGLNSTVLTWEDLHLNSASAEVTYSGYKLYLTPKEYYLLELFLRNPQVVFSRSAIIDRLWSIDASPSEGAVTNLVKDLRQKLKTAGMTTDLLETVYGLGYRLKHPPKVGVQSGVWLSGRGTRGCGDKEVRRRGLASVSQVMERYKDTFAEQVKILEQVEQALQTGKLSQTLRQSASQEAHKLTGSLGTFGCEAGSKLARAIEHLLTGDSGSEQAEASQLSQLIAKLQQELAKPPATVLATATAKSMVQSRKVLVIDDDVALTERLKGEAANWRLANWGLQIEIATDLMTAKKRIAHSPPDAILLDLSFPNSAEDGLTLLEELAEQFTIPVLAFTERDSLADRVAVSRLGGRSFLHKPLSVAQIFEAISQVLFTQTATAQVMVVDDDPAMLTALSNLLQPKGLQVTSLQDSKQFWNVLTAIKPDLLILDLEMPTFDGVDLCQVVRQDIEWENLPVLIVTAHTGLEAMQRAFAAGADDFISKPVAGPELITRVVSRLRTRLRQQVEDKRDRGCGAGQHLLLPHSAEV